MRLFTPTTQRIFVVLLILVMLFGAVGATAYADEGTQAEPPMPMEVPETAQDEELPADAEAPEGQDALSPGEWDEVPYEEEEEPEQQSAGTGKSFPAIVFPVPNTQEESVTATTAPSPSAGPDGYDPDDPLNYRVSKADGSGSGIMTVSTAKTHANYAPKAAASGQTLRKGIDVANHQGDIDWNKVAKAGMEFAIIRVAYRGTVNPTLNEDARYAKNLKAAKAAGLKVGAYIFSQATTVKEAQEEADYVLKLVKGYSIDLPLVFDYEEAETSSRRLVMSKLTMRQKTDICNAFCDRVEASGYDSMVYASAHMMSADLYRSEIDRLWLAHWTTTSDYSGAYEFWQCSGNGSVNGINTAVDLDFWYDPGPKYSLPPEKNAAQTTPTAKPAATPKPSSAVQVPAPKPVGKSPFEDVKQGDWYYDSVLCAYEAKIVTGMDDDTFDPNGTATRAQVVTMIHRLAGAPSATGTTAFTDLSADWYRTAVLWASARGIVSGLTKTQFVPDGKITREQLVTMLYRQGGSPKVSGDLSKFSDASSVQSYAENAMIWAVDKGIITGYSDDSIQPGKSATRAEVCTILMRFDALS